MKINVETNRNAESMYIHRIYVVREIIMWGNPDNTSCQSAELWHTLTSSKPSQTAQTTRMSSCAFCAFMLAIGICSTIRHCCASWRGTPTHPRGMLLWFDQNLDQVTPMHMIAHCWGIAISTWRVRLVSSTQPMRQCANKRNSASDFWYCILVLPILSSIFTNEMLFE